jgi:hypothetical protein
MLRGGIDWNGDGRRDRKRYLGVLDALCRREPYRRWLLIFDNAEQPKGIVVIPPGSGDVFVTFRNRRRDLMPDSVPVDVLSRTESIEFLAKRIPQGARQSRCQPSGRQAR